ncbi:MAG: transcriptional repressor [Verrucomicrobiota bacterium]
MNPRKGTVETIDPASIDEGKLGFRMTKQRKMVYDVILDEMDHPSASEVFLRVKERMPSISLATVYNCLETLTQAGFVKQVNMDRAPSRYCPNQMDHGHFFCSECGEVRDVFKREGTALGESWSLPRGSRVEQFEMVIKGVCPECAKKAKQNKK